MKKLLLLITTAILAQVAIAQVMIQPTDQARIIQNGVSTSIIKPVLPFQGQKSRKAFFKNDQTRTVTYNYETNATSQGGSTFQGGGQPIHPSSNAITVYKNSTTGKPDGRKVYTHGFGQIFDASSPWFQDDTMLYYGYKMHWDSLYMTFAYFRNRDTNVVDTLYIYSQSRSLDPKFINAAGQGLVPLTFSTSKINTMASIFDTATLKGLNPVDIDTILLTKKDSTSRFRVKGIKIDKDVYRKSALGYLAVFRPGKKGANQSTDTLFDFSGKNIVIKNNVFFCYFSRETVGQQGVDKKYNFGQFITTPGKDSAKQNPNFCQPYNFDPASILHVQSYFVVTATFNSIEDLKANGGYGVSNAFPNPANQGQTLTFQLTLPKAERTTSFVTNMLGQRIGEVSSAVYASGNTFMNINTQNLTPGIYFYTVQAGSYTVTKKFTIGSN